MNARRRDADASPSAVREGFFVLDGDAGVNSPGVSFAPWSASALDDQQKGAWPRRRFRFHLGAGLSG
jgi:hypothetical protein